jgi:hypothetical protein
MALDQIIALLRRCPFVPIRLHLSYGRSFTIQHPELVMPGRMFLYIGIPALDQPPTVADHVEFIALIHIVSAEEVSAAGQAG